MKNLKILSVILATALILTLTLTSCDGGGGGGGGGSNGKDSGKDSGTTGGSGGTMTWTAVKNSPFGSGEITAIAFGNGKFVAVSKNGKIATSADGVTWKGKNYDGYEFTAIAFGNGMFVVGGEDDGLIAYSSNGEDWDIADSGFSEYGGIYKMAYGGGKFVAWGVDSGYNGKIATSTDGKNWTAVLQANSLFAHNDTVWAITYGKDKFVAVGDTGINASIWTSTNGTSWTKVSDSTLAADGKNTYIQAIAWGNNKFVVDLYPHKTATSPDGTTWTATSFTLFDFADGENACFIKAIAYGSNKFVAGGSDNKIAYSTDGKSWSTVSVGQIFIASHINAIAWGNNTFVAGSEDGKMAYSK